MGNFEIYKIKEKTYIERHTYPRFVSEITFGKLSDVEDVVMFDECNNTSEIKSAMTEAGDYIMKNSK